MRSIHSLKRKDIPLEPQTKKFDVENVRSVLGHNSPNTIFSFEFFDRTEECFNLGGARSVCDSWFVSLLETIKELSGMSWSDASQKTHYSIHQHEWDKVNFKYKLFDDETLEQLDCYQFGLSAGKGRVHGFKIDNVFYVYWLDPNHNMYDVEGYPSYMAYKFKPLPSCMEVMDQKLLELQKDNENLRRENKELWDEIIKKEES